MILTKRVSRVAALSFGLTFFVTAGIDALGLHECPHHDAVVASDASPGHELSGHGERAGGAPAAHGDHHEGSRAPSPLAHDAHGEGGGHAEQEQHEQHDGGCTCVGSCQLGGGQAHGSLPVGGADARLDPPAGIVVVRTERHPALLPGAPEFLLPFANAPPGPGSTPS